MGITKWWRRHSGDPIYLAAKFALVSLLPLVLLLSSVRLLVTETWLGIEYSKQSYAGVKNGLDYGQRMEIGVLTLGYLNGE